MGKMTKEHVFKAKGYLEKSYLDKDGAKHIVFEVSSSFALEIAKLELMARDLVNHRPLLLELKVKASLEQGSVDNARQKKRSQTIR